MKKIKIDIKTGFIIVLGLVIVLMILLKPSKGLNYYEDELNELNNKNKLLLEKNDSLYNINNTLQIELDSLSDDVDSVNLILGNNKKEIDRLKNRKGEIFDNVNNMDVNDVTRNLSGYLKRRG
jgi:peptidoglycan hydrolase CwlO-like protein